MNKPSTLNLGPQNPSVLPSASNTFGGNVWKVAVIAGGVALAAWALTSGAIPTPSN